MTISQATVDSIGEAARLLAAGQLVAFPTETVYGLGADATNGIAVARIYETKGRPQFNPLIAHVADLEQARRYGEFNALALRLAATYWPGPLTLVVRRHADCSISDLATAGLDSVALRVPSHPVALSLLRAAGRPIAAPSANRSGHVSPTTAAHVDADFPTGVAMILDGGPTDIGLESTVIDCTSGKPVLLRPGGVTTQSIEASLATRLERRLDDDTRPQSPGQLASHYAPRARVRLNAATTATNEAYLAFGATAHALTAGATTCNISPSADLREAAANLFSCLRALDATGADCIAVGPIPNHGLGEAINDRLRRAAAPR